MNRNKSKEQKKQKALGQIIELPCETTDKHTIKLSANIETLEEVDAAIMSGAIGDRACTHRVLSKK
jgi:phosphoenolpyruvate-protein kinase (PTS system EI component)